MEPTRIVAPPLMLTRRVEPAAGSVKRAITSVPFGPIGAAPLSQLAAVCQALVSLARVQVLVSAADASTMNRPRSMSESRISLGPRDTFTPQLPSYRPKYPPDVFGWVSKDPMRTGVDGLRML